jgi:REP element-mobilizing transposase RayT
MRRSRSNNVEQLSLFRRGGKRERAGRKPAGERALVAHSRRARVTRHTPVFVTTKLVEGLPNLRRERTLALLRETLAAGSDRFGFRLVEYSLQSNHAHFLVEAEDQRALARGMKGLLVRLAKALNRAWERRGRVIGDRYHALVLKTPRAVRHALVYAVQNARKHGSQILGIDAYSSGPWFGGWADRSPRADRPLPRPNSWLLSFGWTKRGLIATRESPRGGAEWDPMHLEPA